MLCGVRLLDKSRHGQAGLYRIEVWTKFAEKTENMGQDMETYIKQKLIPLSLSEEEQKDEEKVKEKIAGTPVKFTDHNNNKGKSQAGGNNAHRQGGDNQGKSYD